ncbi:hypothetical protein [Paludibacterium yongneupense]|uniref:hypothetical protein n=1 Tax=Paludibacterium yongneupense TaxID=400061 RepID=UPI0004201CC5|nr:hypothetical protein [Paludibacterium yongneupense]
MYTLPLNDQQLSSFDGAVARRLLCEAGMVWISFDGEDILLHAGESWSQDARHGERLLVQAVAGNARVRVERTRAPAVAACLPLRFSI